MFCAVPTSESAFRLAHGAWLSLSCMVLTLLYIGPISPIRLRLGIARPAPFRGRLSFLDWSISGGSPSRPIFAFDALDGRGLRLYSSRRNRSSDVQTHDGLLQTRELLSQRFISTKMRAKRPYWHTVLNDEGVEPGRVPMEVHTEGTHLEVSSLDDEHSTQAPRTISEKNVREEREANKCAPSEQVLWATKQETQERTTLPTREQRIAWKTDYYSPENIHRHHYYDSEWNPFKDDGCTVSLDPEMDGRSTFGWGPERPLRESDMAAPSVPFGWRVFAALCLEKLPFMLERCERAVNDPSRAREVGEMAETAYQWEAYGNKRMLVPYLAWARLSTQLPDSAAKVLALYNLQLLGVKNRLARTKCRDHTPLRYGGMAIGDYVVFAAPTLHHAQCLLLSNPKSRAGLYKEQHLFELLDVTSELLLLGKEERRSADRDRIYFVLGFFTSPPTGPIVSEGQNSVLREKLNSSPHSQPYGDGGSSDALIPRTSEAPNSSCGHSRGRSTSIPQLVEKHQRFLCRSNSVQRRGLLFAPSKDSPEDLALTPEQLLPMTDSQSIRTFKRLSYRRKMAQRWLVPLLAGNKSSANVMRDDVDYPRSTDVPRRERCATERMGKATVEYGVSAFLRGRLASSEVLGASVSAAQELTDPEGFWMSNENHPKSFGYECAEATDSHPVLKLRERMLTRLGNERYVAENDAVAEALFIHCEDDEEAKDFVRRAPFTRGGVYQSAFVASACPVDFYGKCGVRVVPVSSEDPEDGAPEVVKSSEDQVEWLMRHKYNITNDASVELDRPFYAEYLRDWAFLHLPEGEFASEPFEISGEDETGTPDEPTINSALTMNRDRRFVRQYEPGIWLYKPESKVLYNDTDSGGILLGSGLDGVFSWNKGVDNRTMMSALINMEFALEEVRKGGFNYRDEHWVETTRKPDLQVHLSDQELAERQWTLPAYNGEDADDLKLGDKIPSGMEFLNPELVKSRPIDYQRLQGHPDVVHNIYQDFLRRVHRGEATLHDDPFRLSAAEMELKDNYGPPTENEEVPQFSLWKEDGN